jgi:hypothetical protein
MYLLRFYANKHHAFPYEQLKPDLNSAGIGLNRLCASASQKMAMFFAGSTGGERVFACMRRCNRQEDNDRLLGNQVMCDP